MVREQEVDLENDGLVMQSVLCDMGLSLFEATQLAKKRGLYFFPRHPLGYNRLVDDDDDDDDDEDDEQATLDCPVFLRCNEEHLRLPSVRHPSAFTQ